MIGRVGLALLIWGFCSVGRVVADGMPHIYVYSGYGEPIDGYRVAYLITDLRGEDVRQLPKLLRDLQHQYPAISRLLLLVYANEESAELSQSRMGELPIDGDSESELDKYLVATYKPSTGILTIMQNDQYKNEHAENVIMDWAE